jgi:hypothetical protein
VQRTRTAGLVGAQGLKPWTRVAVQVRLSLIGPDAISSCARLVVRLDGAGDDFRIIGQVSKAMRRGGIAEDEIENFCDEAISGHDHDLVRICGRWVTLVPE